MTMQEQSRYETRSGRVVKVQENGGIVFDHVNGYITPEMVPDAAEYFESRKDDELGRWRWPENPDYVVYPMVHDVQVLCERDAFSMPLTRAEVEAKPDASNRAWLAARAYFEAHPIEPKPTVDEIISALRECARDSASGSHASSSPLLRGAVLVTQAADALEELRRGRR